MGEIDRETLAALKYLSGDTEFICRLCLCSAEGGVSLDDARTIKEVFEDNVTYEDMLKDLGAVCEPSLPQMLCTTCAELAVNSFIFHKLCQISITKWQTAVENFDQALDLTESLGATVKTTYLVVQNKNNLIFSSRKLIEKNNKPLALSKFRDLMKSRQRFKKVKKKLYVICEECGEKFPSKRFLKRHMNSKGHKKKYSCTECSRELRTKEQLGDHIERFHKPKVIQCPKCPKMFSSEKMLKIHNSTCHMAVVCKRCFVQFPSRQELTQHLNRHDTHICAQCKKVFHNKSTYNNHTKLCISNGMKQEFSCDLCQKRYFTKPSIRSHLALAHGYGTVFPCNWCKKPFDSVSKLKVHIVKHTRERKFYCEQCGGKFVTQAALVNHIRIHTGERPFPCDMCDESFLSASRRMEHKKRKHFGPNRECPVCHNKFVTGHELKKHVARHTDPQSRLFVAEHDTKYKSPLKRKIMYF